MKRIVRRFGWTLLLAATAAFAQAPQPRAWLDRGTMQLGETVTLNVEAQDGAAAAPDFSALKQDFDLLGTQSSQQISIVNGKSESKTLWAVGLEPKHAGRLTIPPLTVGQATTAPIALDVQAPSAATRAKPGGDVFVEVEADPATPYVQQQVRYVVKLYYAFDLTDGNLAEPAADGLATQRLGQEKRYVATVEGRRYNVVERHYALTPERSGTLEIPALVFRGNALDVTDPTGFFSRGRGVVARSEAIRLEVKPKPASWTGGAWLPAAGLLLKDETELPQQMRVGDPVTRTIRLQAQGLGFEQLPELDLAAPAGTEMYPDKADTRTRDDGKWLYGERVRKFAFVPSQAGTLTIPGLGVRWWDTVHDRMATAELPPRTITVLPAAGIGQAGAPGAAAATPGAATSSAPTFAAATTMDAAALSATPRTRELRRWKILAVAGFALWLATLALWWWRSNSGAPPAAVDATQADAASARAAFLRACALGEFAGAERELVAWARAERPGLHNLGQLATALDDMPQREALAELQRTRYAGASSAGLGARLQQAFRGGLSWRATARRGGEGGSTLPPLYPRRG